MDTLNRKEKDVKEKFSLLILSGKSPLRKNLGERTASSLMKFAVKSLTYI